MVGLKKEDVARYILKRDLAVPKLKITVAFKSSVTRKKPQRNISDTLNFRIDKYEPWLS